MKKNKFLTKFLKECFAFLMIGIGTTMAACALEIFLIPNSMIDGGLTGISIILSKITLLPLSLFIVCLNIPFLLIGYKQIGKKFLLRAAFAMILFAYLLNIFNGIADVTDDIILAAIYGGLLLGIGVGLVIKFGACLDGTEIVAILISKTSSVSVGQVVLFFNVFIYTSAIFVFGPDRALYSLLTYFITFKLIDVVSEGVDQVKAVTIITDKGESISSDILKQLGRNVTILSGKGLMSHPDKTMLYVVITRLELPTLRNIIEESDDNAFVTICDVSEMIGNHVKKIPRKKSK